MNRKSSVKKHNESVPCDSDYLLFTNSGLIQCQILLAFSLRLAKTRTSCNKGGNKEDSLLSVNPTRDAWEVIKLHERLVEK